MNTERSTISDSAALLELSKVLNGSQDLDFILGNVLLSSMGKLLISRGCVFLRSENGAFYLRTCKGVSAPKDHRLFEIPSLSSPFLHIPSLDNHQSALGEAFLEFCNETRITYLLPMNLEDRVVGLLAFGPRITKEPLSDDETMLLQSIAAIAATAIGSASLIEQLRETNRLLDQKIQEQQTLYEMSREMNTTFDEQAIYRLLGYALMGHLRILRYALVKVTDTACDIAVQKLLHYTHNPEALLRLAQSDTPYLRETPSQEMDATDTWLASVGVKLVIPLLSQNRVKGMLLLGDRMGANEYSGQDIAFLQSLATRIVVALESVTMFHEIIDKQRLEEQIQVARTIQEGLLPKTLPAVPGYDLCGENTPSQHVGGDYYDVIPISPEETVIAIADVSGKGIPASLLMANMQAALRILAPLGLPLPDVTTRLNTLIYENTGADKFITFFWGILHSRDHTFTYINAGHNPPLLIRQNGTIEELTHGGIILGALPTVPPYESGEVRIEPGDVLVLYTDGFNEALSATNEEFSEERVRQILTQHPFTSASHCIGHIREELSSFTRGAPQSDDITMIALYRK